jgi:hypothetical protein
METPILTVMTLNVYFGCEFGALFAAAGLPEFIAAVGELWRQAEASEIPARCRSIAHEIAAGKPDLVALQEVARWSTGTPGAMAVKYDFLRLILEALRTKGVFYTPVVVYTIMCDATWPSFAISAECREACASIENQQA